MAKEVRSARLDQCVVIIRALLRGEEVTHDGLVTADRARVWTLPTTQPIGADCELSRTQTAVQHTLAHHGRGHQTSSLL